MQNCSHEVVEEMTQQQAGSTIAAQHDSSAAKDSGYVAGIDIGGTNLRLVLANMAGTVVARWSSSTVGVRDPHAVIALINEGISELLEQLSAPRSALNAVAAGAPGITNVESGVVIATSYLMGWRDIPLRALLESALGAPSTVDNDVNLAAIGEHWVGAAKGVQDFVFIGIGTGVGASIMINGDPFRGSSWGAGEIGYMLVPEIKEFQSKPGEPGGLERVIGGDGIKAQWQSIWRADKTSLPNNLTATQIFDRALAGDPLAQSILEQTARMLSHAIYNISLVLNCPLFVLGGGVGVHPGLCTATEEMLNRLKMRGQPKLTTSALGADAQQMGALRLALNLAGVRGKGAGRDQG
jgi:glucokinase